MRTLLLSAAMVWAGAAAASFIAIGVLERRPRRAGVDPGPLSGWALGGALALLGPLALPIHVWTRRRRASAVAVTAAVALVVCCAAIVLVAERLRHARQAATNEALARTSASLREGRWERPVLRGAAVEGNAAEAQAAALVALADLPESVFRLDKSALSALASERSESLQRLRAATQRSWAWTAHDVDREAHGLESESKRPRMRAAHLLQGWAVGSDPGECLRIATDLVRLGQDGAAGGGLVELVTGANIIKKGAVTAALGGCAPRATLEERAAAAAELRVLAKSMPPAGHAFAVDALFLASAIHVGTDSTSGISGWLWWEQSTDATEQYLEQAAAWRALDSLAPQAAIARADELMNARASSDNALVSMSVGASNREYLPTYLDAEAFVRMAAIVLEARVIEARSGALPRDPPEATRAAELADPYSGAPLHWRHGPNELRVWSVGEDMRDSGGADGDLFIQVRLGGAK